MQWCRKTRWDNFVNFSYKQKYVVYHKYKYCYCITKVQNGLYNLGYNKTIPKTISNKHRNYNAHVAHACLVQLRANGTKNFTSFVLFWLKNRAQVKLH